MKRFQELIALLFVTLPLLGQSYGVANIPQGTSLPAQCSVGSFFFKTDAPAGQNIYGCTDVNVWTLQASGGGLVDPGSNGFLDRTALNVTAARTLTGTGSEITVANGGGGGDPTLSIADTFRITGKTATAPMKVGTSLPGTCTVGDLFYKSDAVAGQNIYGCTDVNVWTLQAGGGGGDVLGPATNTDNFIPQWNGADSKTLKNGLLPASVNTASSLVQRDGSGNFLAGSITASLTGGSADIVTLGDAARFKFSDTATSYPALIGQGAATLVNHFLQPTAQNGRHYAFAAQMDSGATTAGDKVAGYFAAQSDSSTSDVWAGNFLAQHNSGDADINMQTVEIDFNENHANGTLHSGTLRSALSLVSGGSYKPGAYGALYINSTTHGTNDWLEGIHIDGVQDGIDINLESSTSVGLTITQINNSGDAELVMQHARGTPGSKSAVQAGDYLAVIRPKGYTSSAAYGLGGWLAFTATDNYTSTANGGKWRFSVTKAGTVAQTETVIIPDDGGIQLAVGGLSAPTCDATHRGTFWYTPGGAGVKDIVQVCAKDASNVYAWRAIY